MFDTLDMLHVRASGTHPIVAVIGLRQSEPGALDAAELAAWLRACADDVERTA